MTGTSFMSIRRFACSSRSDPWPNGAEMLHAVGSLNGGGEVVHLQDDLGKYPADRERRGEAGGNLQAADASMQDNPHAQHTESDSRAEAAKVTP